MCYSPNKELRENACSCITELILKISNFSEKTEELTKIYKT